MTIEESLQEKARGIRENGCRTDVEQLRINWFADEIQLRTNSRQDEQSNRNECAPHTSKRTEKRESTTCSIHRPSSLLHRFTPFFYSKRTRARFLDTNQEEWMLLHVA